MISYNLKQANKENSLIADKTILTLQKELNRSHDFLQRLLESIVSAVIVADSTGTITLTNKVANTMFSSKSTLIGQNIIEVLPFDELLTKATPLEMHDSTLHGETMIKNNVSNRTLFISYSISHVVDPSGEQEGLVCILTDITKSKNLERQLLQSQKLEAVGHLAAGIAHEINTPIQYIRDNTMFFKEEFSKIKTTFTPLLTNLQGEDSQTEEDIDYAFSEIPNALKETLEGIEAVADIVRSMKEFSHPGSENKVKTDLNKAIKATVTICKNEWKYVSNVLLELDEDLPLASCFPSEINQVLMNLIVNSAHAIEEKMNLEGTRAKGTITFKTNVYNNFLRISISDTGAGIKKEIQDKIFEPFFTTKDIGKGTGQGLSLVYACITQKHEGKVSFETEVGKGTTFHLDLPINI